MRGKGLTVYQNNVTKVILDPRGPSLSVLLPSSLTADAPDLRQKTLKIGLIGRALAIFRVAEVVIYNDNDPHVEDEAGEARLVTRLLRYMEAPQYLRKYLFPRAPELRYAGMLSPLRTPHHPLEDERAKPGDYREAVVIKAGGSSLLELGLPYKGIAGAGLKAGERVTVRLGERRGDKIAVTPIPAAEVKGYWGYRVLQAGSLEEGLGKLRADFKIGTSRLGQNPREVKDMIKNAGPGKIAVAFGGPYAGLFEICWRQGVDIRELFDVIVNTAPNQATATIRTEEALIITLALLNALAGE